MQEASFKPCSQMQGFLFGAIGIARPTTLQPTNVLSIKERRRAVYPEGASVE